MGLGERVGATIAGAAVLGGWHYLQDERDKKVIRQWLRVNTKHEPGESHAETIEIAKGTSLPEDRVRKACMTDREVFRAKGDEDRWSIWCKEPISIYEKRGMRILELGGD